MDRLGYDVIKVESGTASARRGSAPGPHAPAGRAQAAGRRRAPGAPAQVDRRDPRPRPGRPSTSTTRCSRTSPGSTCPPATRAGPSGNDPIEGINRPRASTTRGSPTTTTCATCSRSATPTASSGLIMRRMRRTGVFDRALLVVVADHGYSFEVGVKERRQVTETNFEQVAAGAVLRQGARTDARARWTTASCATSTSCRPIADLLGTKVWWKHDGRSAFSAAPGARRASRCRGATSAA